MSQVLPAVPAYYVSPKLVYDMAQRIQLALDAKLGWLEKSFHIARIGINSETGLTYPQTYKNDGTDEHASLSPDTQCASYSFIEEDDSPIINVAEDTIEYFLSIVVWNNLILIDPTKEYDYTSELVSDTVNALSTFSAASIKTEIRPEKIFDKYTETTQDLKQFLMKRYSGFKISFSVVDSYSDSCVGTAVNTCDQNIDRVNALPASVKACVLLSVCPTCADADITNSTGTFNDTVASGGTKVLADIDHIQTDGTVTPTPAQTPIECTPCISITAAFTVDDDTPTTGQSITFTDTSTGSPTSWFWDFGDGTYSTAQNPTKTYYTQGAYTARLRIQKVGAIGDTTTLPVTVGFDADAILFHTGGGITGATQKNASDRLVINLKGIGLSPNSNNLWTQLTAGHDIFPYCPVDDSTANATAYAQGLKGNFTLTFNNFIAGDFIPSGLQGNGTTKYAQMGIIPSTHLTQDDTGLTIYSNTNSAVSDCDIGCIGSGGDNLFIFASNVSDRYIANINDTEQLTFIPLNTELGDSSGLIDAQRTGANTRDFRKQNSVIMRDASASTGRPDVEIYAHARNNNGSVDQHNARKYSGFAVRPSFNASELEDWKYCWDEYQNSLGRKIVI